VEVKLQKCALFLLLVSVLAFSLAAQDYPWPTHETQGASACPPNVLTNGQTTSDPHKKYVSGTLVVNDSIDLIRSRCPNYPNAPVPQYGGHLTSFLGRYVDSNRVRDFQAGYGMRTLRAKKVIVAPETNRVYMIIGSTFVQWDLGRFFQRLPLGELVPNTYFSVYREQFGYPHEKHMQWEGFAYPEGDIQQVYWKWVLADGQDRLFGLDYDDRGFVYLAYHIFGWAIVGPNLEMNAPPVSQRTVAETPSGRAFTIVAFKAGGRYYALVSDRERTSSLYDTTTASNPQHLMNFDFGILAGAKVPQGNGHAVALATSVGTLRIYNGDTLASGGAPATTLTSGGFFPEVTAEGSTFYAVDNRDMSPLRFMVIRNNGSQWVSTTYQPGDTFRPSGIRAGGGHITIYGDNGNYKPDVRVYKMVDGAPAPVATDFFPRYYQGNEFIMGSAGWDGKSKPSGYTNPVYDAVTASYMGRTVLFYSGGGFGDVYEINGTGGPLPTPNPTPTPSPTPTPTPGGPTPTPTPTPPSGGCPTPSASFATEGIQMSCPNGNCQPGVALSFSPYDWGSPGAGNFSSSCYTSFQWTFGDGTQGSGRTVSKTYQGVGPYSVTLTVNGTWTSQRSVFLSGSGGTPTPSPTPGDPTPTPTPTPTPPPTNFCSAPPTDAQVNAVYRSLSGSCTGAFGECTPGETIEFNLEVWGGAYAFGTCHTVTWSFPGGETKNGVKVQHAINATGNQPVTATVYVAGQQKAFPLTVRLSGPPAQPITSVDFSPSATNVAVNTQVTFVAAAQPDESNVTFSWDFDGNPGTIEAIGKTVQYSWTTPGDRVVTVTAARGSSTAQSSKTIRVTPPNSFAFLLPVVAHMPGQGGTSWRTDLQIYNTDPDFTPTNPMKLEVEFKGEKKELIDDSSTYIREDFMSFFTSQDAAGPMIVRGNSPHVPQMWTRTYTVSATGVGTYGQLIPAVPMDPNAQNIVTGASKYFLAGLESSARFRTNIGLINPTPQQVTIEVIALDDKGAPYGAFNESVGPFSLVQISNLKARIPSIPENGKYSVRITNQAGTQLVAYQSMIDQISNDPVYIEALSEEQFERPALRVQWVPGVARLTSGAWKTDFTVFNPDEFTNYVDVTFFNSAGAQLSKIENYPLGAKNLVSFSNVLNSGFFNIPAGDQYGTIRVETRNSGATQRFPLVQSRTYSDQGDKGTYGQGIPGFAEPNVLLSRPAFIAGVRANTAYRTNFGVLSLSDEGTTKVKVILLDKISGAEIGAWAYDLGPRQLTIHPNVIRAMHGTADSGTLKVVVEQGGPVWAFASIIDNLTSDAEYVPATMLAVPAP
jgi:hypothetical protein